MISFSFCRHRSLRDKEVNGIPPIPPSRPRPKSVPSRKFPIQTDYPRNYDCLTPEIIYQLSEGTRPESVYGERPESTVDINADSDSDASPDDGNNVKHTDVSSTSGIGSDKDLNSDVEDTDDEENAPEPNLEDIDMSKIPQINLRPEKIDSLHIPLPKGDRKKYDFDASFVEVPPYEFKSPISEQLQHFNFREASRSEKHWCVQAKYKPKSALELKLMDRLIEMERLQRKSEDIECGKRYRLQSARHRARSAVSRDTQRQTVKLVRDTSRKCTVDCVQMACVGDCPTKMEVESSLCLVCRKMNCVGNCSGDMYDPHSRSERDEVLDDKCRPKTAGVRPVRTAYTPTTPIRANGKTLNSANSILNRPKSGHSRGSVRLRESRPQTVGGTSSKSNLEDDFDKLGLESQDEEDKAAKPKFRGRASVVPGKSYFSQRRNSLTDIAREIKMRALTKKRTKSAKKKRPKTAV